MAVNLTKAEIRQFELAGITREMIGKTIERDRAAGLPDNEIELKAAAKAEQLEKANPSIKSDALWGVMPERGMVRAISNLPFGDSINRGLQAIGAAYDATLDYVSGNNKPTVRQYLEAPEGVTPADRSWKDLYNQYYDEGIKKVDRTIKEMNYDVPKAVRYPLDVAGVVGSYGLMPTKSIPTEMAIYGADAFQSGYNKDLKDRAINGALGAGIVGALGAGMPVAEKVVTSGRDFVAKGLAKRAEKAAEKDINVVKNEVSKTLGDALESKRYVGDTGENMLNHVFSQVGGKDYAQQETLVRQLPSIVKQSKKTGKRLINEARENVNKSYGELASEELNRQAKLLKGVGKEEEAKVINQVAKNIKEGKAVENIDDFFVKGVNEAEEGLAALDTKTAEGNIIDLLDNYLKQIKGSNVLTPETKERLVEAMFRTGMTRRGAKRIAFIDETKLAKDVTKKDIFKAKAKYAADRAIDTTTGAVLGSLGGAPVAGGIGGYMLKLLGRRSGENLANITSKYAKKKGIQDALERSLNKSKRIEKEINDVVNNKSLSINQKAEKIREIQQDGFLSSPAVQQNDLIKALHRGAEVSDKLNKQYPAIRRVGAGVTQIDE